MARPSVSQLPKGRHRLSREEVETDQRLRIFIGMADAMQSNGYVGTPVAEIIKRAGVSRETFYQLYSDKLDAFLAAFDLVGEIVLERLAASVAEPGTATERLERGIATYLDTLITDPGYARLFLVEVHAAGAEAMARRIAVQQQIVDALAELFEASEPADRFGAQVLVAAVSAMVVGPIMTGDMDALRALGPPVLDHVRRLHRAGLLGRANE